MTTTVSASDTPAQVFISENGAPGDNGSTGASGAGLNEIRLTRLQSPICQLFKKNQISSVSAPSNSNSDVSVIRNSSGSYKDFYGVISTQPSNVLREESQGVLIEGATTNLALQSESFSSAPWGPSLVTITDNTQISPAETLTGDTITFDSVDSWLSQSSSCLPSSDYTFSVWVKGVAGEKFSLWIFDDDGVESISNITLSDEWVRASVSISTGLSASFIMFRIAKLSTQGDDASLAYCWGAQCENLPLKSSYLETLGAPVIRAKDDVYVDVYNNLPDISQPFTACFNLSLGSLVDIAPIRTIMTTSGDLFFVTYSSGVLVVSGTGAGSVSYVPSSSELFMVFTYDGSVGEMFIDGTSVSSATMSFTVASSGDMYVGSSMGSFNSYINISDMSFYDFKLNQQEISFISGV